MTNSNNTEASELTRLKHTQLKEEAEAAEADIDIRDGEELEEIDLGFEIGTDIQKKEIVKYENKYSLTKKIVAAICIIMVMYTLLLMFLAIAPKYDGQFINVPCITARNSCTSHVCGNVIAYCDTYVDKLKDSWGKEHDLTYGEKMHRISSGIDIFFMSWHESATVLTWILYSCFLYTIVVATLIIWMMHRYETKILKLQITVKSYKLVEAEV